MLEAGEVEEENEDEEEAEEDNHRVYFNATTAAVTETARRLEEQSSAGNSVSQLIRETMSTIVAFYTYVMERTYASEMRASLAALTAVPQPQSHSLARSVLEEVLTRFNVNYLQLQSEVYDSTEIEEQFDSYMELYVYHLVKMKAAVSLLAAELNSGGPDHYLHHHRCGSVSETELMYCLRFTWCSCQMYFSVVDEYLTMQMLDDSVNAAAEVFAMVNDEEDEDSNDDDDDDDDTVIDVDSDVGSETCVDFAIPAEKDNTLQACEQ